ncbi:MAG TPA: PQQ-dependent sugar dehydrogenase [Longimicrobiales bacterium]|nr:PQQ-dependent sugar dehydrogenase [Longimicrobiales bacterium]
MRTPLLLLSSLLFTAVGATSCRGAGEAAQEPPPAARDTAGTAAQDCEPLETRAPNAPDQQPAFPGQTRACRLTSNVALDVTVLARGLEHPWAVEPLPGGDLLVTERPGRMRIVTAAGEVGAPIAGVPAVAAGGQGGLLDVALSPDFASDRTIFWSFSEPRDGGNGTSVARGVLSADRTSLQDVRIIVRTMPTHAGRAHFGSRLAFGPDGMLYITLGDRAEARMRRHAQQLDSHLGKILRVRADGSAPDDNPFAGQAGARPEIWSLGHRNVQAASFDDAGRLWIVEHGTQGGDELNLIERGENYGWPVQAFGEEYRGAPIAGASPNPEGFRQPVYYWDPVIAPSGAQFYTGDLFPEWQGSLLVGGLVAQRLVRLRIEDGRVTGEEHLLADRGQRVRDVRQGPDGTLYVVTNEADGELWRIRPRR